METKLRKLILRIFFAELFIFIWQDVEVSLISRVIPNNKISVNADVMHSMRPQYKAHLKITLNTALPLRYMSNSYMEYMC